LLVTVTDECPRSRDTMKMSTPRASAFVARVRTY
jgi:hypothetical protein